MSDDYQVPDYMTRMLAAMARMETEMARQSAVLAKIAAHYNIPVRKTVDVLDREELERTALQA